MATVTLYRNGTSAGIGGRNLNPAKRGVITGWSAASVRRHTKWLYSVEAGDLTGDGFALTLTMRDTPPTAAEFERVRVAWTRRVERMAGYLRMHWVIEWQRRGTPHIHAAVYFDPEVGIIPTDARATNAAWAWLELTEQWGSKPVAQDVEPIDTVEAWLRYLSKHAARGVAHYQRQGSPDGWLTTGRLWGKRGTWPEATSERVWMDERAYWHYRRLVRSFRVADARSRRVPRKQTRGQQVGPARRALKCANPRLSAVRGVSEWVPVEISSRLLDLMVDQGYDVREFAE